MTKDRWPSFITRDLGPDDDAEMMRRWEAYDRDMKALVATGTFHQDEDGWWVETETGELVGPDPLIERPLTSEELAGMRSLSDFLEPRIEPARRGELSTKSISDIFREAREKASPERMWR